MIMCSPTKKGLPFLASCLLVVLRLWQCSCQKEARVLVIRESIERGGVDWKADHMARLISDENVTLRIRFAPLGRTIGEASLMMHDEIRDFKPCAILGPESFDEIPEEEGAAASFLSARIAGHYGVPHLTTESGAASGVIMQDMSSFPTNFYINEFWSSPKNLHSLLLHLIRHCRGMGWYRMALLLRPIPELLLAEPLYTKLAQEQGMKMRFFFVEEDLRGDPLMQVLRQVKQERYSIIFDWLIWCRIPEVTDQVLPFYSYAVELGLTKAGTHWIFHENSPSNYFGPDCGNDMWHITHFRMRTAIFRQAAKTFAGSATASPRGTPGNFFTVLKLARGKMQDPPQSTDWRQIRSEIVAGLHGWPGNRRWHVEESSVFNRSNLTSSVCQECEWDDIIYSEVYAKLFIVAKQVAMDGLCQLQPNNKSHQMAVRKTIMSIDAVTPFLSDRLFFNCVSANGTLLSGASAAAECASNPSAAYHTGIKKFLIEYPADLGVPFPESATILEAYVGDDHQLATTIDAFVSDDVPIDRRDVLAYAAELAGEDLESYTRKHQHRWSWMGQAVAVPKDFLPDSCGARHKINESSLEKECVDCPPGFANPLDGSNACTSRVPSYCKEVGYGFSYIEGGCAECLAGYYADQYERFAVPPWRFHTGNSTLCGDLPYNPDALYYDWNVMDGTKCSEVEAYCTQVVDCNALMGGGPGTYGKGTPCCQDLSAQETLFSSQCKKCQAGEYSSARGSIRCQKCGVGTVSSQAGASKCELCHRGEYAEVQGQTSCTPCVQNHVTDDLGATSKSDCRCKDGTYPRLSNTTAGSEETYECMECPGDDLVRMDCTGHVEKRPQQIEGYYIRPDDHNVFICSPFQCEIGMPGSCKEGREGLACGKCKDHYYPASDGSCKMCDGFSMGVFMLVILAGLILLAIIAIMSTSDRARVSHNAITTASALGQFASLAQVLASVRVLGMSWKQPFQLVLTFLAALSIDFDVMRAQCVFGSDDEVHKYAAFMLLPLVAAVTLLAMHIFLSCMKPSTHAFFNTTGFLMSIVFIPLLMQSLEPMLCRMNPSGEKSLPSFPSIICGSREHSGMMVIACIGLLLYIVGFITCCAFAVLCVSGGTLSRKSLVSKSFRFLFDRFKPPCYWYGLVLIFRGLLVCIINTVFVERPDLALNGLVIALCILGDSQCRFWPWRTFLANMSDATFTCGLLVLLSMGAGTMTREGRRDVQAEASKSMVVVLALMLLVFLTIEGWLIFRWCRVRSSKRFSMLLSHHKGSAALVARLIKQILNPVLSQPLFLDSDNLYDLDTLFEVVRSETQLDVILMTPPFFTRPWCVGEVITAWRNNVPILRLNLNPGADVTISSAELESIFKGWTTEQWQPLLSNDISPDSCMAGIAYIESLPSTDLPTSIHSNSEYREFKDAVLDLSKLKSVRRSLFLHSFKRDSSRAPVPTSTVTPKYSFDWIYLVVNCHDAEAAAAAATFQLILDEMEVSCTVVYSPEDIDINMASTSSGQGSKIVVAVLLTKLCLSHPNFCKCIQRAFTTLKDSFFLPVLTGASFEIPSLSEVRNNIAQQLAAQAGCGTAQEIGSNYMQLLKIIAMPYSAHLSISIIEMEIRLILERLHRFSRAHGDTLATTTILRKVNVESGENATSTSTSGMKGATIQARTESGHSTIFSL